MNGNAKRAKALERAAELKATIQDYLVARSEIKSGLERAQVINQRREEIMAKLGADQAQWDDWHWQMRNRISDVNTLSQFLPLTPKEKQEIQEVQQEYRWAISPYYLSTIDPEDPQDPVRLQAIPLICELDDSGTLDPMGEEFTTPAPCITRRYPDRLIIKVTNQCAMYCRHCQRRRNIGSLDQPAPRQDLEAALGYIRNNEEIRDVLITGGDALMLSDETLDWLLGELDQIPHVEMKRLGSRTPVTLPQRITPELCEMLGRHHPLYLNTHFNCAQEVTPEAAQACDRLSRAGIPLGNQAVLLRGINDDPHKMKKLNHSLLKIRVRPYYIFHAKSVKGTGHFQTEIQTGMEIMEKLRGYTSGMAVPNYIVNAPLGFGKTPVLPDYIISWAPQEIMIRTWEGRVMSYPNGAHLECDEDSPLA